MTFQILTRLIVLFIKMRRSYFSKEGIEYNLGRVPIGGTDFSTRGYTYSDDNSDATLKGFKLTIEDFKYKVTKKNFFFFIH